MRIKNSLFIVIIFLVTLLAYLLWPLGSSNFAITHDQTALDQKNYYLNNNAEKHAKSPNIILITVDDLGMADVSLYGEGTIQTPNIDRLGAGGVVFENAYVTSPVCAPSRAALITGRYQQRFGFEFTIHERYLRNRLEYLGFKYFIDSYPWEARWATEVPDESAIQQQGLPSSEITLAEILKKHGYKTGIMGKWHLGYDEAHLPSRFGFDEQYGFFSSHSLYAYENTKGIVDQKIEADWTDPYIWSGQRNDEHGIYRNNKKIEEKGYLTDRITDESIAFIEKNKQEPFFLWVSYNAPHTPLQAPQEYINRYKNIDDPVKRIYAAMIHNLDDNIGRLMKYIEDNNLDNSLIFLISDNGGAEYTFTTDNGRYEGGKNTEFEGGIKVPMIIRWNNILPNSVRYKPMVSSMDIFSTSLAAAEITSLPEKPIDGVNLLPFLLDSLKGNPHQYLYWQRGMSKAIRTNEWKLLFNDQTGDQVLYNLDENKYENPDMHASRTEIVDELKAVHKNWRETHASPLWPPVIYYIADKDGKSYYFEQ